MMSFFLFNYSGNINFYNGLHILQVLLFMKFLELIDNNTDRGFLSPMFFLNLGKCLF